MREESDSEEIRKYADTLRGQGWNEENIRLFVADKQKSQNAINDLKKSKSKRNNLSPRALPKNILEEEDNQLGTIFQKAIHIFLDKKDLARKFMKIQPLYYDKSKVWWLWDKINTKWVVVDETEVLNKIDEFSTANTIGTKEKAEIIESLKQVGRKLGPKKIKSSWIQFKDTIYDLDNDAKFPATSEYFVTNPLPYALTTSEECPTIDRIFEEWVEKDNVRTLYEILAYCMLMSYPLNIIFCLIGSGMNGKSCFLALLRKWIGETNCCSTDLDTLMNSRFEKIRLYKKLVCQMGETNFNTLSNTSLLKKLSGGDTIGFEFKGSTLFEDYNYAKIIISTNNLPETTDKTNGFYRRWLIVDFPNQFTEKKDILSEIPEQEYSNLSSKCLNILKKLLKNREFTNGGTIGDRQKRYEDRSNPFDKFFKENVIDGEGYITKVDFESKLKIWCIKNHFRTLGERTISNKMKDLNIFDERIMINGKKIRVWSNISWKIPEIGDDISEKDIQTIETNQTALSHPDSLYTNGVDVLGLNGLRGPNTNNLDKFDSFGTEKDNNKFFKWRSNDNHNSI